MVSDGMLLMQKVLKTFGDSSHLLQIWKFLEVQSALKFNLTSRYSAVHMTFSDSSNSQISLEMAIMSLFCGGI